jgi:predicted nucleic acid-binding protein
LKKVLFDSDVLLDILAQRQPFVVASAQALNTVMKKQVQGFVSGHAVTNIFYILRRAEETEFQTFLQWIRQKFNVETGQLWSSILLFHSADEKSAVDRFFTLFEEFYQNQKNHETAKIDELVS